MNPVQLTGRHLRLKDELAAAHRETPRNPGRIERLMDEIAATERLLASLNMAAAAQPPVCSAPVVGTPRPTHSWIGSFAGRLMQLRPTMSLGAAVRYAVMSIHHAEQLDPVRAAELLVMADPVTTPIAGRRVAGARESHVGRYEPTPMAVRRSAARMSSGVTTQPSAANRR